MKSILLCYFWLNLLVFCAVLLCVKVSLIRLYPFFLMCGRSLLLMLSYWAFFVSFLGCQPKESTTEARALARVKDRYLYANHLPDVRLESSDSLSYSRQYVRDWILEELMLDQAKSQSSSLLGEIEEQVRNYRKAITRHVLEQAYIEMNLPELSEEDISSYYQSQVSHFILNEDITRVLYVKVLDHASSISAFRSLLRRRPLGEMSPIREYCLQNAPLCVLSDTTWIPFHDALYLMPISEQDQARRILPHQDYLEFKDTSYVHLIRVLDYRSSGSLPPLEYIRDEIVLSVLSQRKRELSEALREDIWNQAKRNHEFEIYP